MLDYETGGFALKSGVLTLFDHAKIFEEKILMIKTLEKTPKDIIIELLLNNILITIHKWLKESINDNTIKQSIIILKLLCNLPVTKDIVLHKSDAINKTISKLCKSENESIIIKIN